MRPRRNKADNEADTAEADRKKGGPRDSRELDDRSCVSRTPLLLVRSAKAIHAWVIFRRRPLRRATVEGRGVSPRNVGKPVSSELTCEQFLSTHAQHYVITCRSNVQQA